MGKYLWISLGIVALCLSTLRCSPSGATCNSPADCGSSAFICENHVCKEVAEHSYEIQISAFLTDTNNGSSWDVGSKPDPYVVIYLDETGQKSELAKSSSNDDTYSFNTTHTIRYRIPTTGKIVLEFYDSDLQNDDLIGRITVNAQWEGTKTYTNEGGLAQVDITIKQKTP